MQLGLCLFVQLLFTGGRPVKGNPIGETLKPGMQWPCPRCKKKHRVLEPELPMQRLDFIRCNGELVAVGLEGRPLAGPAKPWRE